MNILFEGIPWMVLLIVLPLIGGITCFLFPGLAKFLSMLVELVIFASVCALSYESTFDGVQHYQIGGWGAPLGIELYLDGLSLLMLIAVALVGLGVSIYSSEYFSPDKAAHFWPLWWFLRTALHALFLSADIFNLYVTLELIGLTAVSLVALANSADAVAAAMRYLLVGLLGSLCYLLGVALLYHGFGSLDFALLAQRIKPSPSVSAAIGLISAGLLLKTALFPMHFWLPAAHGSAPTPVSAVLSALVIKASFYLLLRFWLVIFPLTDNSLGQFLGLLGAAAVFWGGIQALRQTRLKLLVAYSTVAQIGYLFLAFPLGTALAWRGVLFMVLSHALAKSAMFMAAGNIHRFAGHDRITELERLAKRLPLTLMAFSLAGASIIGLPPSGGFIAKWMLLEASLNSGQWGWAVVLIFGGLLAAAYVFKVIGYAFTPAEISSAGRSVPARMEWTPLLLALAALLLGLFSPWVLTLMDIGSPLQTGTVG